MTTPLVFRPLASESDWEVACSLRNESHPDHPATVAEMQDAATRRAALGYAERGLFWSGGEAVGFGGAARAFWIEEPTFFVFAYPRLAPSWTSRTGEMLAAVEELAREQSATEVIGYGRDDQPWFVTAAQACGYRITQSNRALRLDLAGFQAPEVQPATILSYPELAQRWPDTWEQGVWRLEMDLMADVPLPQPWKDTPFVEFQKALHSPMTDLRAYFVALEGEELAGLSQLIPNRANPKLAATALTGVRRAWRRRGLASALKVHALTWARTHGFEHIHTDTEANNPMGQLNHALGFVFDHEMILMAKNLG